MATETLPTVEGSLSTRRTVRFTGVGAHRDAIAMTQGYLTPEQWAIFMQALADHAKFNQLRFYFMMVGVEGFPVRAMLKEFHPRYVRRFGAPSKRRHLKLVSTEDTP